jgi:polymorphic toxin system nucleotidyltransferase-like protein
MDETLAVIVRSAEADLNILAVFLHGSRAVGHERPDSDYDIWFLTAQEHTPDAIPNVDAASVTIEQLREAAPTWWTDGLVQGQVIFDRTRGELESILARLAAAEDAERPYDGYLNAFVRGKSAARRGDELGARLHAADSVRYLVEALAALDGQRPPFHDRLANTLGEWEPRVLGLLREPTVERQLALFAAVREHMESRGASAHTLWKDDQLR